LAITFGACQNEKKHTAKLLKMTYFEEHNLQQSKKISLHHAKSIISVPLNIVEADWGPLRLLKILRLSIKVIVNIYF